MDVRLVVQAGEHAGRQFAVDVEEFVIGRDHGCDLRLQADRVSQRHCRIRLDRGRVLVEDLGSSNGTMVNDRPIRSIEVQDGDRLKIGATSFKISMPDRSNSLESRADDWIAGALDTQARRPSPGSTMLDSTADTTLADAAKQILGRLLDREHREHEVMDPAASKVAKRSRLRVGEERGITVVKIVDHDIVDDLEIRDLDRELGALVDAGHNRMLLNFNNVEHISSQAIGVLVQVHKRCKVSGGLVKLCRLRPDVAQIFNLMGMKKLFEIHADEAAALKSDWPPPTQAPAAPAATLLVSKRRQEEAPAAPPSQPPPSPPRTKPTNFAGERTLIPPSSPAQATKSVRLVVETGRAKGQAIEIKVPEFSIGRDAGCQLRPNSPIISRRHALISQREGRVFVRDQGTPNGTLVNDRLLHGEEVEVVHGDRFQIGPIQFTFAIEDRFVPQGGGDDLTDWLISEAGGASYEAPTTMFLQMAQPSDSMAPKAAPTAPRASSAAMRYLKYEVVGYSLVITLRAPELNDEATVGPVRYELQMLLERPLPRREVLRLDQVTFLSSSAVGMILAHFQKLEREGGTLRLCCARPVIMTMLEQMRLTLMVDVFPTLEEALKTPWG